MKKITVGILALSIVALLGISLAAAFPFGFGKGNPNLTEEEQAEAQAFHDSLQQAIEDGDFATWKSLMESQLTEENFNLLVERHQQMSENMEANGQTEGQWGGDGMRFEKGRHFGMEGECPFADSE